MLFKSTCLIFTLLTSASAYSDADSPSPQHAQPGQHISTVPFAVSAQIDISPDLNLTTFNADEAQHCSQRNTEVGTILCLVTAPQISVKTNLQNR